MTNNWPAALDRTVDEARDQLVRIRRHLHQHPELSGNEHETTAYIANVLRTAGLDPKIGPAQRGVIVEERADRSMPKIALRADIDALPIAETRECAYRSTQPGVMHACGHDGHTATVLGAILALAKLRDAGELPCPVRWRGLFQPAEETLLGAKEMTAAGALDGVGAILSMHMDPSRPVGTIGVRNGAFTANCDTLKIDITGRGGHGARPHQTIDPIAVAAQLITALYAQLPRLVDSQDAIVISFGQVVAGEAANVIPDRALLRGTLRTLDPEVRRQAKAEIERVSRATAEGMRAKIDLEWYSGIGAVVNDAVMTDLLREAGAQVVGQDHVREIARASMGSEDFASYLEKVPGSMFRLGCASPAVGNSGLHTPTFDLDEQALVIGAKILARGAILWSQKQPAGKAG